MQTLIIMSSGFVTLAIFYYIARDSAHGSKWFLPIFSGVWFVVAVGNMAYGIISAGYSFTQELPIFLVVFLVPVGVAYFLNKQLG